MNTLFLLAQTSPAQPTSSPAPPWLNFVPIILIVVVIYFFMMRPQRTERKQRQQMLDQLKKGDVVQTIGGILGKVMEIRDNEVVLKVDESTNAKMRFVRSAIHRVVQEDKAESK